MGLLGALFGSALSFSVVAAANRVRLQPIMREPWYHLGAILLGGYGGYKYTAWRNQTILQYEEAIVNVQARQQQLDLANEELDTSWRKKAS